MRKVISGLLMAVLALMFIAFTTGSSNADASNLSITQVGYNAIGADTYLNRNKEFVDVTNTTAGTVNVAGLDLTDTWSHNKGDNFEGCNTFTVPAGLVDTNLDQGEILRIYMGDGTNTVSADGKYHIFYARSPESCGYHGHILNNMGDVVWIKLGTPVAVQKFRKYNFETGYTVS